MSILAALAKAYERLPDAPPYGFSEEKIGFLISLNADGSVAHVIDLREGDGRKKATPLMLAPQGVKRASGIAPNFLWDKTAYALGVTAGEGKRTADEHAAFVERHRDALAGAEDPGLLALDAFLARWTPDQFVAPVWSDEMKDQNVAFTFEPDRRETKTLQDRPAARDLWRRLGAEDARDGAVCLVTGETGPVARLHTAIKGVWGAQSSGASIVSFNLDAFTSYGHEQGDNAPVSEAAVFAYTTALNRFLVRDSGHRIQIGDASTVFWADASNVKASEEAEALFAAWMDPSAIRPSGADEATESAKVAAKLEMIAQGRPLAEINPALTEGVRFYVLALAPNAARLSIRFYLEDDFGVIAERYRRFLDDMRIDPPPRDAHPALWKYLAETAVLGKRENVPPNLAGEWLRSILSGAPYPMTLLATVLMRIRADGDVTALRVSMMKAVLIRNLNKEAPVSLDPECRDKGYILGRLFAVYEHIQSAALGQKVNATVKDKFYASASAQPRKVFALLEHGSANHLSKVGKSSPGRKINLEKQVGAIMDLMAPSNDPYPAALSAEQQALFGLGYYHQRNDFFRKPQDAAASEDKSQ